MSTIKGSAASNGVQPIPAGSRKMVQSLKEIVNCPEAEIYAALKECNMDPNEAINRLLSQDTFHEVKSKREKKKEGKDTSDSRPRAANISSNRGGKNGGDRYPSRGSSASYKSSDSAPSYGKPTYKKENVSSAYTSSLPTATGITGTNRSRVLGDAAYSETKGPLPGTADGMPAGGQAPLVNHSPWCGVPGQLSMADIVKRGIQQYSKAASDHASEFRDSGVSSAQNVPVKDEWPSIEKPAASKMISIPEPVIASEVRREAHIVSLDSVHQDHETEEDRNSDAGKDQETEDDGIEDSRSSLSSARMIPDGDIRDTSLFENDHHNLGHYQPQAHEFEQQEVDEVSASVASVSRNLQNLSVNQDDRESPAVGSAPSVVIPDHLQVQTADCSHLSFGSFGAGLNVAYSSGTMASVPVRHDIEEQHSDDSIPSVAHPDTRRSEYYVDDSLQNASDGSLFHGAEAQSLANHDASADSHPEELKPESAAEIAHGNQYSFPSSNSGYSFDEAQHLNTTFNQPSSEMQNLASFPNIMQPYPNSLQSTLLAVNAHPSRESELHQYSQFPTQLMSAKYGNSVSSLGGPTISMSEALKTTGFSSQPSLQALSGTGVATGPPLPQHLAAMHPYSPYANMIGYPFMPPQSYTYMPPSAFQQAFAGNSSYHQSLAAALLPQYKNSISVGSLPQSAANIPSGYFANAPGNYTMNQQPSAASGANLSYDDVLNAQYKDNSHLISLQQQNEWLQGVNSRTMSAVPASTYYNYINNNNQGQAQQQAGGGGAFRQAQGHQQQNYGYPNVYHSQTVDPQQPQIPRESQQQQQAKQIWHNGY